MNKRVNAIYWISTIWIAAAMVASAIQQIFFIGGFVEIMSRLAYPTYFSVIIGIWKIAGVVVILAPKLSLLKEWAYAGFVFVLSGAIFSHLAVGDGAADVFPAAFLLVLTIVSWYFRPVKRKLSSLPVMK